MKQLKQMVQTPARFKWNDKSVASLANEAYGQSVDAPPIRGGDRGSDNQHGEIYLANESRFVESNFSEPLTTFAVGWKDPNDIQATLEFVSPSVPTNRRFEYILATNTEEFLSEVDDVRGIGSSFKRIEFTSHKVQSKTINKGLTIRVDEDNVDDMPNWEQVYTSRIMRRLLRNELRRAITLLSAASLNTNYTWEPGQNTDPELQIRALELAYADAVGLYPSRALYGDGAWVKRQTVYASQNTSGGFAGAQRDPAGVARWLQLDDVMVSKERWQSSTAAKSRVTPDVVLLFLAEANQTPEDPSNIKRFVSNTSGGTPFRVYVQRINSHLVDITVEHYSQIVVTSTLGLQQATIS